MQSGIYHLLTLYMVPSGFLVGVFVCQWVCVCVCVGGDVVDLNVPEHFQCTLFKLQIE